MKLAYFIDNIHGSAIMHPSLEKGFAELGIPFEKFNPSKSYDCVLILNCVSHNVTYDFVGLEEITGKFAFIDTAEYGWWTHHPYYARYYHSAFAPLSLKSRYEPAHRKLIDFLRGKSFPYFLREYYNNVQYNENYHPIDYPLYWLSLPEKGIDDFKAFKERPIDITVCWGQSHPARVKLTEVIKSLSGQFNVFCSEYKIPQRLYFDKLNNSKLSITFDGYGSGSFREMEIPVRCAMLKNKSCIVRRDPFIDNVSVIEYIVVEEIVMDKVNEYNIGYPKFVSTNLKERIIQYLNDIEKLYSIYKNGYEHCMKYFTCSATAQYIIDVIKKHDWSKITEIPVVKEENLA